jgi:hypothetical protein
MASSIRLSWIPRSLASVLVASPLLACEATPGSNPGGSSSSGEPTTGPDEAASSTGVSTPGSSSESSTQGTVADDSGTGTTSTSTDTEDPAPVPICESNDCSVECTQELQLEDEQGNACTCITAAVPPEWVWCNEELPFGCGGYTCILESLRDGVLGRYSWGWSVKDEGGMSVFLEVVAPGRARALETTFEELACCGLQSRDTGVYHAVFDLPAADDPFWEACLAMAPEIDPDALSIPDCLLPDALRVGECTGEHLTECPAG